MERVSNNTPTRVLQIGMHDKIGGVETFLMNYYRNIDRKKIQFDFVSIYDKLCFENEIKHLGGKVYNIVSEKKNPIKYYKDLKKIIKENNYNIVHIEMLSCANILPILAAKRAKVKHIIVHSHNSNTPSGLLRKLMNTINKPFLKLATDYWACSKLAGHWMFGEKNDFVVIPNAIDINKFCFNLDNRKKIRDNLKINNKIVIGHIGRFCYQKNHDFLIKIFKKFNDKNKNSVLLLIGKGELENKIKKAVTDLNLNDSVIFLGNTDVVEKYLSAMDIFVLPSRFEGLPVTGIEAQVNGLECLFSNKITNEVNFTNNVKFLPIDDINLWVKALNNTNLNLKRRNNIDSKSFDIRVNAKLIENKYLKMNEDCE